MTETTSLADRVSDRAAAAAAGTSIEKKEKTVFDLIRDQTNGFAKALPSMITPERFVRVAITTVRTNPALAACDPLSLLGALTLSAQLGLEPGGPLGHAYLVPFRNNKSRKTEVTFIVGYRGLMALARRSGDIADIYAECVYEGDEFAWSLGLHRDITHEPTGPDRTDPAKITHVYAVAKYRDGSDPSWVVLSRAQVETFRGRSKAKDSGPWVTDYAAMCCKTAVRRLSTWMPMSIEVAEAVRADEQVISGLTVDADSFIDVDEVRDDAPPDDGDLGAGGDGDDGLTVNATQLYRDAVAADQDAVKAFRDEHGIPADMREWTREQLHLFIEWVTAEPAVAS